MLHYDPSVLHTTAVTLATVNLTPPGIVTTPPSAHPVSIGGTAQWSAHARNVAMLVGHANAMADRATAVYEKAATAYGSGDAAGAATINGTPVPTNIGVSLPPHPPQPITLPHPPAPIATPDVAEETAVLLQTGDQGASLTAAATDWRAIAALLAGYQESLQTAATTLRTGWQGDSATTAVAKLAPFAEWFGHAATAANQVAAHADQLARAHRNAVTLHPRAEDIEATRANYARVMASRDYLAASSYQAWLANAQTTSEQVITTYASHSAIPAAILTPAPSPVSPQDTSIVGKLDDHGHGDPTIDKKNPDGAGDLDSDIPDAQHVADKPGTASTAGLKPASGPDMVLKPLGPSPVSVPVDPPMLDIQAPEVPVVPMILGGMGQAAGTAPAMPSACSAAQMFGGGLPSMPQPPQMPSDGGSSSSAGIPPLTPAGGQQVPQAPPAGPIGSGLPHMPSLGGAPGGGGGFGGGVGGGPSASPLGAATPAAAPHAVMAIPTGSATPTASLGMGPMGMMPPYAGGQGSGGGEKERNVDLAPDIPAYTEDRPFTAALVDEGAT